MYNISVIIPMHNAEKYLKEAIDSVCKQTIGFEKIELILVDDASNDNTPNIAREYEKKFHNVIYLKLPQKSGSAGKPRNEGFKLATGKYVMYLDADDALTENACLTLYNTIEKQNADCVIANYKYMDEDGTEWKEAVIDPQKYDCFGVDMEDYKKSFFILESAVWNKIYKTEFIKENGIKFLEGLPAEDAYFCINSFVEAKKLYYCNEIIYKYRLRKKDNLSVSNNCNFEFFEKYNKAYNEIYNKFKKYKTRNFLNFFFTKAILFMIYKFTDSTLLTNKERIEVLKNMHWFFSLVEIEGVIITEKYIMQIVENIQKEKYEEAILLCDFLSKIRENLPKEINAKMEEQNDEEYINAVEARNNK